jgi:hypothetical protein
MHFICTPICTKFYSCKKWVLHLLVTDVSVTAVSYVVASVAKTPQEVLTILSGSALAAEPMVRTTLPKVDKMGTSSVEVPTAQALVAQPRSKAPDNNLTDDDPGLLNFVMVESEVIC